jgi:hypothetical protein
LFKTSFFKVIFDAIIPELNRRAESNKLELKDIRSLDVKAFLWMYTQLSPQAARAICALRPDLASGIENNDDETGDLFERMSEFRFRSPQTLAIAHVLHNRMKQATRSYLQNKTFTEDDIAMMYGQSFRAICMHAIYRCIREATLTGEASEQFVMRALDSSEIRIRDDKQFFKNRKALVEIKKKMEALSVKQEEALLQLIASGERSGEPSVQVVYGQLMTLQLCLQPQLMSNARLRKEDEIDWGEAFSAAPAEKSSPDN